MPENQSIKYKMLCVDIDGTLVNTSKKISTATKQELERVLSQNNLFLILVSSRIPESIDLLGKYIGNKRPVIAYNGALILDELRHNTRQILFNRMIDSSYAIQLLHNLSHFNVHVGIYKFNEWCVNKIDQWAEDEMNATKISPKLSDLDLELEAWRANKEGPHKILLCGSVNDMNSIQLFLGDNFSERMNVYRVQETAIEIAPKNVSKWSAVQFLCEKYHINSNEIIAFGDSENDVEMIRGVGMGIAMGNASNNVKKAAKEMTTSNNDDGIAISLKKYFPALL